jgi:hypothetical protein
MALVSWLAARSGAALSMRPSTLAAWADIHAAMSVDTTAITGKNEKFATDWTSLRVQWSTKAGHDGILFDLPEDDSPVSSRDLRFAR